MYACDYEQKTALIGATGLVKAVIGVYADII